MIATGGDDWKARVYLVTTGERFGLDTLPQGEMKPIFTLEGHSEPVNSLSFSPDNRLLVTASADRSCLIFNVDRKNGDKRTMGQRLHKITFSDGTNDGKNMMMRGCFFSEDSRYLYTLSTETRQKSYIVKW